MTAETRGTSRGGPAAHPPEEDPTECVRYSMYTPYMHRTKKAREISEAGEAKQISEGEKGLVTRRATEQDLVLKRRTLPAALLLAHARRAVQGCKERSFSSYYRNIFGPPNPDSLPWRKTRLSRWKLLYCVIGALRSCKAPHPGTPWSVCPSLIASGGQVLAAALECSCCMYSVCAEYSVHTLYIYIHAPVRSTVPAEQDGMGGPNPSSFVPRLCYFRRGCVCLHHQGCGDNLSAFGR